MNYQVHPTQFEHRIYTRFPNILDSTHRLIYPPSILQSRFCSIWTIAKRFRCILDDTPSHYYLDIEDAFNGLFHCLRFVYSNIRQNDPEDMLSGMTIILPFIADQIIIPDNSYLSRVQWNLQHSMFDNGIQHFIIECYESLCQEHINIDSMMEQIFGEQSTIKHQEILEVVRYTRSLPDHFVPYPNLDEDDYDEEDYSDDNDNNHEEPFIEPNVLFGDAPLRPLLEECCICSEEKKEHYIVTHCRHSACQTCAVTHLRITPSCWYCRETLSPRNTYLYHGSSAYHTQDPNANYLSNPVSPDFF